MEGMERMMLSPLFPPPLIELLNGLGSVGLGHRAADPDPAPHFERGQPSHKLFIHHSGITGEGVPPYPSQFILRPPTLSYLENSGQGFRSPQSLDDQPDPIIGLDQAGELVAGESPVNHAGQGIRNFLDLYPDRYRAIDPVPGEATIPEV